MLKFLIHPSYYAEARHLIGRYGLNWEHSKEPDNNGMLVVTVTSFHKENLQQVAEVLSALSAWGLVKNGKLQVQYNPDGLRRLQETAERIGDLLETILREGKPHASS